MAETSISWTHTHTPDGRPVPGYTFNPWVGCQKVAPACDGCYAWAQQDLRYKRVQFGGPGIGIGTRSRTSEGYWRQPLRWDAAATKAGTRPFVFCASLADIFDKHVDPSWRRDAFALMRETPRLVWLLLTKRPQLIARLSADAGGLPKNAALGTTCEDQEHWDMNVPALVEAKIELQPLFAFVSAEPLLGPINSRRAPITSGLRRFFPGSHEYFDPLHPRQPYWMRVDWIITGGESDQGPHRARPTNPHWTELLARDCAETDTAYHHKQNGEFMPVSEVTGPLEHHTFRNGRIVRRVGKHLSGRAVAGVEHNAHPQVPYDVAA